MINYYKRFKNKLGDYPLLHTASLSSYSPQLGFSALSVSFPAIKMAFGLVSFNLDRYLVLAPKSLLAFYLWRLVPVSLIWTGAFFWLARGQVLSVAGEIAEGDDGECWKVALRGKWGGKGGSTPRFWCLLLNVGGSGLLKEVGFWSVD